MQPLWTTKQVAEITNRSERSVERDREQGTGCPYLQFGRLIRYRPEDVEKDIAARVRDSDTGVSKLQPEVAPGSGPTTPFKPNQSRKRKGLEHDDSTVSRRNDSGGAFT
jgi:hypothetical protein